MLKWASEIFLSEGIESRCAKTIRMLNADKAPYMTWLITRSTNEGDQLEIMNAIYLKQSVVRQKLPEIVGLAVNRREAVRMICSLTEACLKATGDVDLNAFIDSNPSVDNLKKISVDDLIH